MDAWSPCSGTADSFSFLLVSLLERLPGLALFIVFLEPPPSLCVAIDLSHTSRAGVIVPHASIGLEHTADGHATQLNVDFELKSQTPVDGRDEVGSGARKRSVDTPLCSMVN